MSFLLINQIADDAGNNVHIHGPFHSLGEAVAKAIAGIVGTAEACYAFPVATFSGSFSIDPAGPVLFQLDLEPDSPADCYCRFRVVHESADVIIDTDSNPRHERQESNG